MVERCLPEIDDWRCPPELEFHCAEATATGHAQNGVGEPRELDRLCPAGLSELACQGHLGLKCLLELFPCTAHRRLVLE